MTRKRLDACLHVLKDKPLEVRLRRCGARELSVIELVAVLLDEKVQQKSPTLAAVRLLSDFGGISGLARASMEQLCERRGLGSMKASRLVAAFEIARRLTQDEPARPVVSVPGDVIKHLGPLLRSRTKETVCLVCLNARNAVIRTSVLSEGILDSCPIHPREVFGEAIRSVASSIIIAHNHPSGSIEPSQDDISMTHRIAEAGVIMGIKVLDHIIVAASRYYSFQERGFFGRYAPAPRPKDR